jgi:hypothetical protein
LLITTLLIVALFALPGSGVWIGIALAGVAWIGMELFSSRPAGDAMAVTIWGSASSWTLTALPLFVWMGEILFRTKLSEDMFKGLALGSERARQTAAHNYRLHDIRRGLGVFGGDLRDHRQDDAARACPPRLSGKHHRRHARRRGTLGLLIPPSIIMIVYGVAANVSISASVHRASCPACCSPCSFQATRRRGPSCIPADSRRARGRRFRKALRIRHLLPVCC